MASWIPDEPSIQDPKYRLELSEIEDAIISLIKPIINVTDIPLDRNFFDIGFNSMNLIRFSTELSEKMGIEIDLFKLFLYPTVYDLANHIKTINGEHKPANFNT